MGSLIKILRAAAAFGIVKNAHSWDVDGHAAVGMTAMSGINTEALAQLKRLLGGKDIVDIATWSFALVKKYPEMGVLFEQPQVRDMDKVVDCKQFDGSADCPHGHCLVQSLEYFYSQLTGTPGPADFKLPIPLKMSDTDNIKMLVALLAELHSPSKFGYQANRLGKDIEVYYLDNGAKIKTTLYNYWDTDLIQKTIRDRPHFWYSGWTHIQAYRRGYAQQQTSLWHNSTSKSEVFKAWAAETFKASCERVQRNVDADASQVSGGESDLLIKPGHVYPSMNVFIDFEFLKQKILIGGVHTAVVLNPILAGREGKRLRQGSVINVPHERPKSASGIWGGELSRGEGLKAVSYKHWLKAFSVNASIIVVVVGLFAMFIKLSADGPRQNIVGSSKIQMVNSATHLKEKADD